MAKMKKSKLVGTILSATGIILAVTIGIVANVIVFSSQYSATIEAALGDTGRRYTSVTYDGVDPTYYNKDYETKADREKYQKGVSESICEEGMTLLEKGNMPYKAEETKISFFSESSARLIYGGTGSGTASSDLTLKKVFEDEGFQVNDKLWDFYTKGKGKKYVRGTGSINYGDSDDYSINECPLSVIQSEKGLEDTFKEYNTAVFVLSRTGGEGNDLARGMDDYVDTSKDLSKGAHPDALGDKMRSYLEPDSIELQIIDYLNKNFDDVILVVNCNNPIELGWVKDYQNIGTVISVPGTGSTGLQALPRILKGEVNPSGHLTDTYAYNAFSSPAMMNMGDFQFTENGNKIANYGGYDGFNGYYYVNYLEGIYVGYRYYETRYYDTVTHSGNASELASYEVGQSKEEGRTTWDYATEVQYPFGYGVSMTDFTWSDYQVTESEDKEDFIVTVKVTNTGDVAGKEVVQLYAQTPYGDYEKTNGVEKSAVELVGFEKTSLLEPDASETVTISFPKSDLASYDRNGAKTYVMSEGQYYFTVASDAHAAVNNILRKQGYQEGALEASPSETESIGNPDLVYDGFYVDELDTTTYSVDSETGNKVTNLFDFADLTKYDEGKDLKYLTRNDWAGTYPQTYGEVSLTPSIHSERNNSTDPNNPEGYEYHTELSPDSEIYKLMRSYNSLNPNTETDVRYTWGVNDNDLELIDMRGRDINDPLWEKLIQKMTLSEAAQLIQNGGFKTESIASVNKPETSDKDGPAGLNNVSGHFPIGLTYPCAVMIAQTWNRDLAEAKGDAIAEECLAVSITGWYGPGNNIHRTPFAGRNFEYYSEDPMISGAIAEREIVGAAKKGVYAYIKHFVLNDQEVHREKESGICTFTNEQGMREIYLKAFENVVKGEEISEKYYEIKMDSDGNAILDENGNYQFTEKTTNIKACTAIMSSFNRIGPVWAGGCYPLITSLLRDEWGFEGTVCTDYYHFWFMNGTQAVMAGGSLMLDPTEENFTIPSDNYVLQEQAFKAVRSILYTVANSNGVDGYIHGTREKARWKNIYSVMIGVNAFLVLLAGGLGVVLYFNLRKKKNKNIEVVETPTEENK